MSKRIREQNDTQNAATAPQKEPKKTASTEAQPLALSGAQRAIPVVLFALAIFVTLCFFMQNTGTVGRVINQVLLGLFSFTAYLIPVLLALHAIFYASDVQKKRRLSRLIFSVLTLVFLSSIVYAVEFFGEDAPFTPAKYYTRGMERSGGGFVGSVVAYAITKVFGSVGLIIIALLVLALYVTFFFSKEDSTLVRFALKCLTAILTFFSLIERGIKWLLSGGERRKERKRERSVVQQQRELLDDEFFDVDNGLAELQIPALGISEVRDARSVEANPTLREKVIHGDTVHTSPSYTSPLEETVGESEYEAFVIDPTIQTDTAAQRRGEMPIPSESDTADAPKVSTSQAEAPARTYTPEREKPSQQTATREAPTQSASVGVGRATGISGIQDFDAGDVFTSDFDPFDIERNRALARRGALEQPKEGTAALHESIEDITEEQIERMRRRQEFERRKAQVRAQSEAPETSFTFDLGTPTAQSPAELELPESYAPSADVSQKPKISSFTFDLGTQNASAASAGADVFTVTIDKTPKAPESSRAYTAEAESTPACADSASPLSGESFDFSTPAEDDDPFRRIADLVARGEHPELARRETAEAISQQPKPDAPNTQTAPEDVSPIGTILREFETEQGLRSEGAPEVRPFIPGEWTTSGFHEQNARPTLEVRREIIEEPSSS